MPKYTIYVRESDKEKWNAIADKPQFIHRAIEDYHSAKGFDKLKYIVDDRVTVVTMDEAQTQIVKGTYPISPDPTIEPFEPSA